MVNQRRGGRLAVGARHRAPIVWRETVGKLRFAHDLGRVSTSGSKELAELRDTGAGDANVVLPLDVLGTEDEPRTRTLKLARAIAGLRLRATVHGDTGNAVAQVSTSP